MPKPRKPEPAKSEREKPRPRFGKGSNFKGKPGRSGPAVGNTTDNATG